MFEEALVAAPQHRSEILWLLTEAHLSDANPQYDEALASNDPSNAVTQNDLAVGYDRVGRMHQQLGNKEKALEVFEKSLATREALARLEPVHESRDVVIYRVGHAGSR